MKNEKTLGGKQKKLISFESEETKRLCDKFIRREAKERGVTESQVIEDCIITNILRCFPPEETEEIRTIYRNRYAKFIDRDLL